MSTAPVHLQHNTFTSTLSHTNHMGPFNFWLVLTTALIFFAILSIYNLALSIYNYFVKIKPKRMSNEKEILANLGFFIAWTLFVILLYFLVLRDHLMDVSEEETFNDAIDVSSPG